MCSRHHRQHHRGELGIAGNADDPDGVVFTDARGRPLARSGPPRPPTGPVPTGTWVHPTGERLDLHWVDFTPPPADAADHPPCIDLDDPSFEGQREDVVFAD